MSITQDFRWYYYFSEDAEHYFPVDSRDDAIAKGKAEAAKDEHTQLFICEATHTILRDDLPYFTAEEVCAAFEEYNEAAWGEDGPECAASIEAKAELQEKLTDVFAAWRAKHRPWTAYMLDEFRNSEEIDLTPASAPTIIAETNHE